MKTTIKKLASFLLTACFLLSVTTVFAENEKDYFTVRGVVKDKASKIIIEFANISIPGTNIGTVTNASGEFAVKVKKSFNAKNLEVSHLGYALYSMPITGEDMRNITILLTAKASELDQITVLGLNPRELVEEAVRRIERNYTSEPTLLTGFYRETIKKRRSYINVAEAIVEVYKTPYGTGIDRDAVQVYKGRKLISPKVDDTLMIKLLGGPTLASYIDVVKNPDVILSQNTLGYYKFTMEQPVVIDDRQHYVVSFAPQVDLPYALHYGKLYIDRDRLAFSRIELSLSMDDKNKATSAILKKKPFGLRFKPEEVSFMVNYKFRDGKSHMNYVRSEVKFKCDWKRKLFSTNYTIVAETVITGGKGEKVGRIPNKLVFSDNVSLSDKVDSFFDKNFWEDYNIIEPDESLESAVNKLKKNHDNN